MRDQQDVDETLVVGDHDIGATRIGRHRALHPETPQRIQALVHHRHLAESEASEIRTAVERSGHQSDDGDDGHRENDGDPKDEPGPDACEGGDRSS